MIRTRKTKVPTRDGGEETLAIKECWFYHKEEASVFLTSKDPGVLSSCCPPSLLHQPFGIPPWLPLSSHWSAIYPLWMDLLRYLKCYKSKLICLSAEYILGLEL